MAKKETTRPQYWKHKQVDFKPSDPVVSLITNNKYQVAYGGKPEFIKLVSNKRISYENEFGKPFFSLRYHQPNDKEGKPSSDWKFVASANKNSWMSYVTDAHGDLEFEESQLPKSLQPFHVSLDSDFTQAKMFDYKTNHFYGSDVEKFKELPPPHKDAFVYEFVFSFEGLFLRQFWIDKVALKMVADTFFKTAISYHRWPASDWELQVALHRNTNNWHIHGRFYQNENTPTDKLRNRPFRLPCLNIIREKIRQKFFTDETIYSNLYNHKLNLYKSTDLYKRESLNNYFLATALLDILNIHTNKDTSLEVKNRQAAAINVAIKNIMITSPLVAKKNEDLWLRLVKLLNSQTFEETDNARETFLENVKNEISRAFKKVYLENIDKFLVTLDGAKLKEWIVKNETADLLAKPDLAAMMSQFINFDDEVEEDGKLPSTILPLKEIKRKAAYHNPSNISESLTFNKMANWSPNVRKFYKSALTDLGKIFLKSIDIDFTKIELLIKRLEEFLDETKPMVEVQNKQVPQTSQYYEERILSVKELVKNILKM